MGLKSCYCFPLKDMMREPSSSSSMFYSINSIYFDAKNLSYVYELSWGSLSLWISSLSSQTVSQFLIWLSSSSCIELSHAWARSIFCYKNFLNCITRSWTCSSSKQRMYAVRFFQRLDYCPRSLKKMIHCLNEQKE